MYEKEIFLCAGAPPAGLCPDGAGGAGGRAEACRTDADLSFNGTTATCKVTCSGNRSDTISATLTLYQGSTYVTSWSASGTGRVTLSKTRTVTSGKSYTLAVTYSINGTEQTPVSVTATCP